MESNSASEDTDSTKSNPTNKPADAKPAKAKRTNTKSAKTRAAKAKRANTKKATAGTNANRQPPSGSANAVEAAMPASDNVATSSPETTTTARFNIMTGAPEAVVPASDKVAADAPPAVMPAGGKVAADAPPAVMPASDNVAADAPPSVMPASDNVAADAPPSVMPLSDNVAPSAAETTATTRFKIGTGAIEPARPAADNMSISAAEATTTARLKLPTSAREATTPVSEDATTSDAGTTTTNPGRAKKGWLKRGRSKTNEATASQMRGDGTDSAGSRLPVTFAAGRSADMDELEPVSESIRYILARPGGTPDGSLPTRIAVIASLPGEGATTISRVFSSVLSNDFGIETCRVDLSWGSTSKPGIYEVLIGEADVDDVLDWDGRTATLHSGAVSPSERPRLARSEELDKLIAVLASRFQHVILDLPAILSGSDGLAMMRLADSYLLVVKHGVTTLRQVQIATEQLSEVELLGSVLNHVRTRTPRPLSRWLAG